MKSRIWHKKYDRGVPHSIRYPRLSIDQLLEISAERFPNRVALIFGEQSCTYKDLWNAVTKLSSSFRDHELRKEQPVGLILPNNPQFVLCYYAILRAGGVVVAVNPHYKAEEIRSLLMKTGTKWVICGDPTLETIQAVHKSYDLQKIIISEQIMDLSNVQSVALKQRSATFSLSELLNMDLNEKVPKKVSTSNSPAVLQFSGGTTGTPKAALGLHRNLVANTFQFRKWLAGLKDGSEVVLAAIPLFHVYGMVIAMNLGVYLGATIVLFSDPRDSLGVVKAIDKYRVTLFPGVPSIYFAINNLPSETLAKYSLASIKACISGSAPLSATIKKRFEAISGGKLMEGYGLSEAPTATHCNPMLGENRMGSIGLPLPDVDCQIVDLVTGKKKLPCGEAGELIIKGPQVMQGYYNDKQATCKSIRQGWLFTGDIARMDTEGYFFLVGRKKDLIKVGGFQVWPNEIEEVLLKHSKVKEVAVAGVPNERGSETVIAWIVTKTDEEISTEELRTICKNDLADYKIPHQWIFCDALPKTTVGKVLRRELVGEYLKKKSGSW